MPQVGAAYNDNKQAGLDIMIILGENQYSSKPTLQYCKQYADQHGVSRDKVYLDYGNQYGAWETTMTNIYPYIPDSGMFSLPWDAVLDGDSMVYMYSSSGGGYPSVIDALNAALSD